MSNLRHVNAVAGRLSLRAPQRRSLEILDRITEIVPPTKNCRHRRGAGDHQKRVSGRHELRTRFSFDLFCVGNRRRQDPPHGRLHHVFKAGARHQ